MTGTARGGRPTPRRAAVKKTETPADPDLVIVDLEEFAASEIEMIEELTNTPITHATQLEKPQGAIMRAMAWVTRVRDGGDMPYEVEDCGRGVRPRCTDCSCSRRLKVGIRVAKPVPRSGGNGSSS